MIKALIIPVDIDISVMKNNTMLPRTSEANDLRPLILAKYDPRLLQI